MLYGNIGGKSRVPERHFSDTSSFQIGISISRRRGFPPCFSERRGRKLDCLPESRDLICLPDIAMGIQCLLHIFFVEPGYAISRDTGLLGRGGAVAADIYRYTAVRNGAADRRCTENIRQATRGSLRILSSAVDPVASGSVG